MIKLFDIQLLILCLCICVGSCLGDPISEYIRDTYLHIDPEEADRLTEAESLGLMEISTVILPEGENLWGNNFHFGWPVAAMKGDTIIVCSRRKIYHSGCGTCTATYPHSNDSYSGPFYVRSVDRGETWGPMVDLVPLFENDTAPNAGGMSTIGVNGAGEFIIPGRGALRSLDDGLSWGYYSISFSQLSQPNEGLGPNLVNHPVFDMLLFNGRRDTDPDFALIRRSINGWYYWFESPWNTTVSGSSLISNPKEPAAVTWGPGHILLLSREFNTEVGEVGETFALTQDVYEYQPGDTWEDVTFVTKPSGILAGPNGVWAHDTAAVIFNPVTSRIEVLDSARYSGPPPDYEGGAISTLNLWSIDPDSLLAGSTDWRYEGTLLERNDHRGGCGHLDGLHPGGSVVDVASGVQRVFVYAGGEGCSLNGVFQITRTLDTPLLRSFCKWDLPSGWQTKDVGNSAINGGAIYRNGTFRVRGSGNDIWNMSDEFRYVYKQLIGDGSISVKLKDMDAVDTWSKAGVMVRESLAPDSSYGFTVIRPDGNLTFQYRNGTGASSQGIIPTAQSFPIWIKIERNGNSLQGFYSLDGNSWTGYGNPAVIPMGEVVCIGMAVCSHNIGMKCEANFENISLSGKTGVNLPPDPISDSVTNFLDFTALSGYWLGLNGDEEDLDFLVNDFDGNGIIDINDLSFLSEFWLQQWQ